MEVTTVPLNLPSPDARPSLPQPEPIALLDVEWVVMTRDRYERLQDGALMCVTPEGYEALSLNAAEVLRWTSEAKSQLDYYAGSADD